MKGIPLLLLVLIECCKTGSAPAPLTADQVAAVLEDAGCLLPGPDVTAAVAAEIQTGHDAWLSCMIDGGSIAACNTPCERGGYVRRPGDM